MGVSAPTFVEAPVSNGLVACQSCWAVVPRGAAAEHAQWHKEPHEAAWLEGYEAALTDVENGPS